MIYLAVTAARYKARGTDMSESKLLFPLPPQPHPPSQQQFHLLTDMFPKKRPSINNAEALLYDDAQKSMPQPAAGQ